MIILRLTVNIVRTKISTLRQNLKADSNLTSYVGKAPKSDKLSQRVDIQVTANVNGPTEIELVKKTILYNDGVITKENQTGELGMRTKFKYGFKTNWKKFLIYYFSLTSTNILLRLNDIFSDLMIVSIVLGLCIPVAIATTYGINFKSKNGFE